VKEEPLRPKASRQDQAAGAVKTVGGAAPWLPLVGLLIGVWAIVPPYIKAFGELNVESRVEFADHVVPGIVVLAVSALALVLLRSPEPSQLLLFVGGGAIILAGFWMMATHMPLISQARNGQVPWGAVLWHSLPGLGVTLFGVLWTLRYWGSEETDEVSSGR
jgi:hypothetical protein